MRCLPIKLTGVLAVLTAVAGGQSSILTVQGLNTTKATFSATDLAGLTPQNITTTDHGTPATFQGVALATLLAKVALPSGEKFHSTAASYYLVAEGRDGYRAVFAWAELDPTFMDKAVYVVLSRDGEPLPEKAGPFQLVVPGEKRNARWVRQLTSLRIETAPPPVPPVAGKP